MNSQKDVLIITGSSGLIGYPAVNRLAELFRVIGFDNTGRTHPPPPAECVCVDVTSDGAHHMAKDKSPAECTRTCLKQGTKFALVVGKRVYTLEGHEAELDKLAGMKATVKGKISGETVAVQSAVPAMKMK